MISKFYWLCKESIQVMLGSEFAWRFYSTYFSTAYRLPKYLILVFNLNKIRFFRISKYLQNILDPLIWEE